MNASIAFQSTSSKPSGWCKETATSQPRSTTSPVINSAMPWPKSSSLAFSSSFDTKQISSHTKTPFSKASFSDYEHSSEKKRSSSQLRTDLLNFNKPSATAAPTDVSNARSKKEHSKTLEVVEYLDYEILDDSIADDEAAFPGDDVVTFQVTCAPTIVLCDPLDENSYERQEVHNEAFEDEDSLASVRADSIGLTLRKRSKPMCRHFSKEKRKQLLQLELFLSGLETVGGSYDLEDDQDDISFVSTDTEDSIALTKIRRIRGDTAKVQQD